MNKTYINPSDLMQTIKDFYDPASWRFITVNALEIENGYEIQWIFTAIDQKIEEKIFFATIDYETVVPSIVSIVPPAKYSEAEMQDLLGVVFEGENYGIFLEPDAPKAPLLRKNRDQTA